MPTYFSQDAFKDYRYCPVCNATSWDEDHRCSYCEGKGVE